MEQFKIAGDLASAFAEDCARVLGFSSTMFMFRLQGVWKFWLKRSKRWESGLWLGLSLLRGISLLRARRKELENVALVQA